MRAPATRGPSWPEPDRRGAGTLHHLELWVPDLDRAAAQWGWLLTAMGYGLFQQWPAGRSWRLGSAYVVIEKSPDLSASGHDRMRPGMNHVAFYAGSRHEVDHLVVQGPGHGWTLLFPDVHPHAGGPDQYAAYLTNSDGFEVELVAADQ